MSIRPIEVQASYPQSQKVGKIQEQLQMRSQVGQEMIGQGLKEQDTQRKRQVNTFDNLDQTRLHQDSSNKEQEQRNNDRKKKKKRKKEKEPISHGTHPSKGKFIDFTG